MAASNINRVTVTGNLTRDPELRTLTSGTAVCDLRVAVNTRRKDGQSGGWVDKPNYFDVTVWGAQGENCARFLAKGRPVAIDGRLDWREWTTQDGAKRQAVAIVADTVQFLGTGQDGGSPADEDAATDDADSEYVSALDGAGALGRPDPIGVGARDTGTDDIPF